MKVFKTNKASKSFYRLLKAFMGIKSFRLKAAALLAAHKLHRRYISIYLDPVMACNIRCKMCYFSDEKNRPKPLIPMPAQYLGKLKKALYHRALKLQIGCGAEPTLYRNLPEIVKGAKEAGIPYVELTTNGQLLDYEKLGVLVRNGLDGITLSLHGTTKETYEFLMAGAKFERLQSLITAIAKIQKEFPNFSLRINYTFNRLNYKEMPDIFNLFEPAVIGVLQIRPIQNLGDTAYNDFGLDDIINDYDSVIIPLRRKSHEAGVTLLAPALSNIEGVDNQRDAASKLIEDISYCYISSEYCYKDDFDLSADTFESYWKRKKLTDKLTRSSILGPGKGTSDINITKKMNYTVE